MPTAIRNAGSVTAPDLGNSTDGPFVPGAGLTISNNVSTVSFRHKSSAANKIRFAVSTGIVAVWSTMIGAASGQSFVPVGAVIATEPPAPAVHKPQAIRTTVNKVSMRRNAPEQKARLFRYSSAFHYAHSPSADLASYCQRIANEHSKLAAGEGSDQDQPQSETY